MKEEQRYIQDIAEVRSMMERSTKYLSLSGLAGIMAGIYALVGAFIAYQFFNFRTDVLVDTEMQAGNISSELLNIFLLALVVLVLAIGTAIFLSNKKAKKRGERFWNPTVKRLIISTAVPLASGGLFILILITKGMVGLIAPLTLLFYGIAVYNASKYTYEEVKGLGVIQIVLGLFSSYFIEYGLICWAIGFGIVHIIYGIYLHYRYER